MQTQREYTSNRSSDPCRPQPQVASIQQYTRFGLEVILLCISACRWTYVFCILFQSMIHPGPRSCTGYQLSLRSVYSARLAKRCLHDKPYPWFLGRSFDCFPIWMPLAPSVRNTLVFYALFYNCSSFKRVHKNVVPSTA